MGMSPKTDIGDIMTKTVVMPYLWTRSPKAHKAVVTDIKARMLVTWTFQMIWDEVILSGIEDEDDQLATTRALTIIRDHRRMVLERSQTT